MLQPGDIILVHSHSLIGKLIRWTTKAWANHVAVYLGNNEVLEAKPGGVAKGSYDQYLQEGYEVRVYRFQVSDEFIQEFIRSVLEKTGRKYDFGQIGGLLLICLFHIDLKDQNSHLTICSELIYESAQDVGIPVPAIPKYKFMPKDIENWSILKQVN